MLNDGLNAINTVNGVSVAADEIFSCRSGYRPTAQRPPRRCRIERPALRAPAETAATVTRPTAAAERMMRLLDAAARRIARAKKRHANASSAV